LIDYKSKQFISKFSANQNSKRTTSINIKIASSDTNKLIFEKTKKLYNLEKNNIRYYYYKEARLLYYQGPRSIITKNKVFAGLYPGLVEEIIA
jgi:hypothetical protein